VEPCLYICHPCEQVFPTLGETLEQFRASIEEGDAWKNWSLVCVPLNPAGSLTTRDLTSLVISRKGPVLFLRPVQTKAVADVRLRLEGTVSILIREAFDLPSIKEHAEEARVAHEAGEPRISRNKVISLLLMRKLDREHMWAGNDKGYMWHDDLPKGRGIDEKFTPIIAHITNLLLQHDLLVRKTSKSTSKYALNPARRKEIHEILRTRSFTGAIAETFGRDRFDESVRELDLLDEYLVDE
jgi:hypothetical protein